MKSKIFILVILSILFITCGRQVPEGTTIKVVNETDYDNNDIYIFEDKLREKLKDFNFVVKHSGSTDYTIRITKYDRSSYTWYESPDDDCSWSTYMLNEESTSITAVLYEYEASKLDGWSYTHSCSEKLKGSKDYDDDCYDYRVVTPLWDSLLEGDMKDFARRTARRTSRIVFKQ